MYLFVCLYVCSVLSSAHKPLNAGT